MAISVSEGMHVVSAINDVAAIRRKLFPDRPAWNGDATDKSDELWDVTTDGWSNWNADDDEGGSSSGDFGGDTDLKTRSMSSIVMTASTLDDPSYWLHECVVSFSPIGDVLILARNRVVVWLQQKWDNDSSRSDFFVVRSETLTSSVLTSDNVQHDDFVTAAICLPLASQKRSAHGRQDWTAVLLGFNTGVVRIYTEEGVPLLEQRFDESPVVSFNCRTFEVPRYSAMAEQHEELVVVHKKAVVVVQGLGLYQTLRACRNQAARAAAAGGDAFEAPPLEYKKWTLHGHDDVSGCESIGTMGATAFDRMVAESVLRGSSGSATTLSPPGKASAASLFVATGTAPYVGFYYAVEGIAPLLVSEAVMAAAHKLSTYFTSFFIGAKPRSHKKPVPSLEPATPLPSRFEIRDSRRAGVSICASPNRRLSAVADEFGRVVIVDNHEGIAVRIFKGYRGAQCGWIEVNEEHPDIADDDKEPSPSKCRVAVFLVIYSRRRGILEVWSAQHGPRVAAFHVGQTASLVYCNHCILGATSVKTVLRSWAQSNRCFLLEANGAIRTITVPFHCALRCGCSRARDLHLLEKVKNEIDDLGRRPRRSHRATEDVDDGDTGTDGDISLGLADLVLDINSIAVREQAIDLLFKSQLDDSLVVGQVVSQLLTDLRENRATDSEARLLMNRLRRHRQLLQLYDGVLRLRESDAPLKSKNDDDDDDDYEKPLPILATMFHLSEPEVDRLLANVERYYSVLDRRRRVRFSDTHGPLGPTVFDTSFLTSGYSSDKEGDGESDEDGILPIRLDSSEETMTNLARFLFTSLLTNGDGNPLCGSKDFFEALRASGIDSRDLFVLLVECWLNSDDHSKTDWLVLRNFHLIVVFLSSQSGDNASVNAGYNEVSPWWSSIRCRLRKTRNVAAALTAAIVCRGAAVTLVANAQRDALGERQTQTADGQGETGEVPCLSDWEGVHLDTEQWSLLVKQLEDLVSLATLIDKPMPDALASSTSASTSTSDSAVSLLVTVDDLLERGRGGISELIAKWLTRFNLSALMVVLSSDDDVGSDPEALPCDASIRLILDELKGSFVSVRNHFPNSLSRDVMLANCAWEFAALWNVDRDERRLLDGCVSCLAACDRDAPHRRGLAGLLWRTFFEKPFATSALLIEKMGKAPKDRICRKNLGMSETTFERFLDCCQRILDILMRINRVMPSADDSTPVPIVLPVGRFRCEVPWQDTVGPAPLVDVILEAREPNDDLVDVHRDLAVVVCAIVTFSMRGYRPLSLYDARNRSLFFVDLSSSSSSAVATAARLSKECPDLRSARVQFLCGLISNVVRTMSECEHADAVQWFGRALALGSGWNLDTDELRRHFVCELYSNGFDSMAEEFLPAVIDIEAMGSQLVVIVGQRIRRALGESSSNFVQIITLFSPAVIAWLKSLEHDTVGDRCDTRGTAAATMPLLTYIVNVIPVHRSEHKLAVNLMEGLTSMSHNDASGSDNS